MPLTFAHLKNVAQHAIGAQASSQIDLGLIVNQAGQYLMTMHAWQWRVEGPVTLETLEGKEAFLLPPDFAEIVTVQALNTLHFNVKMTTHKNLVNLRNNQWTFAGTYYATVTYRRKESRYVLEVFPPPTGADEDDFTIYYRVQWKELADDADVAEIPGFCEGLLSQLVQEYAKGYEEQDVGGLSDRLERLERSAFFSNAKKTDGRQRAPWAELADTVDLRTRGEDAESSYYGRVSDPTTS